MEPITYLLSKYSDEKEYYEVVREFSNEVLRKLNEYKSLFFDYSKFIKKNHIEICRSDEEYMVEMLTLAVLLGRYNFGGRVIKSFPYKTLIALTKLRRCGGILKSTIDKFRGVLNTKYLLKLRSEDNAINDNIQDFFYLLRWMEASGEFKYTVNRLNNWYLFLNEKPQSYVEDIYRKLRLLGSWFENEGMKRLHPYTRNVEKFLKDVYISYKNREDIIFCSKSEVEYHLNMVGAEILNKAFRKQFLDTKRKLVLLPACMRLYNDDKCQAKKTPDGYLCRHCNINCNVNKISIIGKKSSFETYIIPHESDALSKEANDREKCGIVGIACVLNLLEGGWKAKELNFIPQCVLLNYCGCKNHWHNSGIITEINMNELKRVFKIYE